MGTAVRSGPAASPHPLLLQPEFMTSSNLRFPLDQDHAIVAA